MKTTYGLSADDYHAMLMAQGNKCAICARSFGDDPRSRKDLPHVDHSHSTGRVRALLCVRCNQGIGLLREDADLLRSAITYLERHKSKAGQ